MQYAINTHTNTHTLDEHKVRVPKRQEVIRKSVVLFKCEQNRNNCGVFLL